ncbi:dynein intermediate chain, cytosolic, putative [Pediculus humanus corporis]|uniref:Dynein intermediate chain, cytosolic, putative n=1 Tax=Pediculus humanus subsp. corporis TaxID=121224 RepID=E0V973_PEDHC|nr:dynein intermediate chain, cytosolic, putative [Pediculus humanus corporis]EEB09929.1 dynein intermediate chain, cytosolic, putative [Pediculus humanus corporis]
MADRKAELDRKKAKLQAIRESKERKKRELEQKNADEITKTYNVIERDHIKEVDEMLSSLGVAPVSDVLSSLSSNSSLPPETDTSTATPPSSLATAPSSITPRSITKQLSIVKCGETNIPGKELVLYSKQTQTTTSGQERDGSCSSSSSLKGYMDDWWRPRKVLTYDETEAEDEENSLSHLDGFQSKLLPGILPHGLPHVKEVVPAVTVVETQKEKEKVPPRELSEEEKQMIMLTEDFQKFMHRGGQIMERALAESVDIYTDYTGLLENEDGSDDKSSLRVVLNRRFSDDRWTKNRCVMSLDWSPQYPELLVASYHNNEDTPNDPDGVCLIWNTKFKKTTPEYIFHCQSPVTIANFARFHPNLILGGTYSGQIVLWDNRVHKRTPIQRTPLCSAAHTHPVYCLNVVGTQNAHNLISISTDGRMCSWSLDMLSTPQEVLELQSKQKKAIAVTALAFPPNDVNNFVIGSEEGDVYQACRHGTKAGVVETYEAHQGPITGLDVHNSQGSIDYSHLFLTSSFDWTIKLWSLKDNKPLHSFEHNADYVYNVAWSPTHPSVFAAVDGTGKLDVWNLNQDTEVPTAGIVVEGAPALNRVSWSQSGQYVTAGDDLGRIWVYEVGEALSQPRVDEWNKFMYTLEDFKHNQADEEIEKAANMIYGSGPSSLTSLPSSLSPGLSIPVR